MSHNNLYNLNMRILTVTIFHFSLFHSSTLGVFISARLYSDVSFVYGCEVFLTWKIFEGCDVHPPPPPPPPPHTPYATSMILRPTVECPVDQSREPGSRCHLAEQHSPPGQLGAKPVAMQHRDQWVQFSSVPGS